MKIIQLIDSLSIGGSERMCVNLANQFLSEGIPNMIVATHKGGALTEKINQGIDLRILHKKGTFDIASFIKLIRITRQYKPDIIHAHSSSIYWATIIKIIFPKIFIVWHDHYGLAETLKPTDRRALHYIKNKIDLVVCVNELLRNWDTNTLKIDSNKVIVLNNFPSLQLINRQVTIDNNSIICIANFRKQKNHLNLLNALNELKKNHIEYSCTIIGSIGDGVIYETCKTFIQDHQLENNIEIITDNLDIETYLAKSEIGVLSSDSEGLPVTILEYGLARLAVISTNVGDCGKVLENGKYGWLVSPNNYLELANQLKYLIQNKSIGIETGNLLYHHVQENYSGLSFSKNYFKQISLIKNKH